ncbi:hypothetical protein [Salinivibrio sp. ES.052]|uniref:hypothetical protein n=1 Tax=Salinivibrio sp. ES.052 TaxID=1882823 RepID=UPI00092AB361|nr:hypothetical protein [Salinivibrio sp. ES.052]SIO38087.1 hypothetical protein SAMN05444724_3131 [Salinivibrio sp. ES.052]
MPNNHITPWGLSALLVASSLTTAAPAMGADGKRDRIEDPWIQHVVALTGNKKPQDPDPASYGMNPKTGQFVHPKETYHAYEAKPFEGMLDAWDDQSYNKNMTVEAYYPITVEPFHTWQNIVDFDGRRYRRCFLNH